MEPHSAQLLRLSLGFAQAVRRTLCDFIGDDYQFRESDARIEPFSHAEGVIAFIHFGGTVQGDCILRFRPDDLRLLFETYCRKNSIVSNSCGALSADELISELLNVSTGQLIPSLEQEIDAISIMPPIVVSGTMTFPRVPAVSINLEGPGSEVTCIFTLNMMRQKIAETLRTVTDDLEKKTRLALTDSLTGLNNRAFFDTSFQQIIETSARTNAAFTLMILDIDRLKPINDNFGHQMGDTIIRETAQTIKCVIRQDDIACRYGGDEFIVLLPGTCGNDAQRVAERIRKRLSDLTLNKLAAMNIPGITMSVGIGQLEKNETPQELFYRTDLALYTAKKGGRDRIFIAAPRMTAPPENVLPQNQDAG